MREIRRRKLESAVWIPLRAMNKIEVGRYGFAGSKVEFFGAGSLAVHLDKRDSANQLGWMDIGISHNHGPHFDEETYRPADVYDSNPGDSLGIHLVLDQHVNSIEVAEWHLHQDLVLALGLKREGDVWVSPNEGYLEVARLRRQDEGSPSLIEVRAEHIRDYLCARRMALYITSYRRRQVVVEDASHVDWAENPIQECDGGDRWEGRSSEIHEGGHPFGQKTAVFHVGRTDVDPETDVPTLGFPTDENVESQSWTVEHEGRRLVMIQGELWRNEWIEPAERSPRIRGHREPPTVFFVTDAEGKRESRQTLEAAGRWLWFRADVMMALSHRRGGDLGWHTRDTGSVRCSPDYPVHFGVNRLGLINVYAKDIALLPEWQQRVWAGHNVGPDGGVSDELLASQARARPAETLAPEPFLGRGLDLLWELSEQNVGVPLLRKHPQVPEILSRCHRFRAVDRAGLFALAKDLARLTAESIDANALHNLLSLPKGTKLGSLKSLEQLLATRTNPDIARGMLGALVGINELRQADAHLPSSEIEEAFHLARVDESAPPVHQGFQILHACVSSIHAIAREFERWA